MPPARRNSIEAELVESALFAVVRFEEAAAKYVALAFRLKEQSAKYRQAVNRYKIACAERLDAHKQLRRAVTEYASLRRRDGVECDRAVIELTRMANRATRTELASAERDKLNEDIGRWTESAYAA
jgi:hypothetical protein